MKTAVRHFVRLSAGTLVITLLVMGSGCPSAAGPGTDQRESRDDSSDFLGGTIDGASMAPTFPGVHYAATCPRCQWEFAYDAKLGSRQVRIFCPLCGQAFPRQEPDAIWPATRVKLARVTSDTDLQRWAVVAYQHGDQISVKRIVGLPGESVSIQQGEVWVNGAPLLKPPAVEFDLRIPVFDSRHVTERQLEISPDPGSQKFPLRLESGRSVEFVNFANYESISGQSRENIKDSLGYNQGLTRALNFCHDFGCQFSILDDVPRSELHFQVTLLLQGLRHGSVEFVFQVRQRQLELIVRQNGREVHRQELAVTSGSLTLDASLIDHHARVRIGQGEKLDGPIETGYPPPISVKLHEPAENQAESGVQSPRCQVKLTSGSAATGRLANLRVYRDIHYFERVDSGVHRLGPDQYFVVGDNVPVSRDSRNNGFYPRRSDIIGVVVE